jgi:TetR/AcrR family fatty acid metabolism transcriptional regulator
MSTDSSEDKVRQERRETILRAAAQAFAQFGYFKAKVADVARAAGVADGTVYLYYRNKEDLLTSIFNWAMEQFVTRARGELPLIADPRERLRRFAQLHFALIESERDLAIVFQVELRHSTKFMEKFSTSYLAEYLLILREVVEAGQREGIFRSQLNPKVVAKFLFGVMDGMATNWVLSRKNYSLSSMVDPVLDLFLNGVSEKHA